MPQIVDVVGYGPVEFPDGTSKAEMEQALKKLPPKPSEKQRVEVSEKDMQERMNPFASEETVYDPVSGAPMGTGANIGATLMSGAAGTLKPIAGALQYAGINKPAQKLEEISQAAKQIGGAPASAAEFVGEVASPLTSKAAQFGSSMVGKIPGLARSTVAKMGGAGAGAAAVTPTEPTESYGDFLTEKAKQVGAGTAFGAGAGKLTQMAMAPQVSDKLQMLKDMGMKYFTPGQLMGQMPVVGKAVQSLEQAATSLPFTGAMVRSGIQKSQQDFNTAVANRVLAPMGETVPKGIKPGEDMVNYVNQRIDDAYETITPALKLDNVRYKDPTSKSGFTTTTKAFNDKIAEVTKSLPASAERNQVKAVHDEFERLILNPLLQKGGMTGEEFRQAEKSLGKVAFNYMRNPDTYEIGAALKSLQGELRQELINQNPKLADVLQGIHLAFRRHLPYGKAAGYLGAEGRVFTPGQFESAVRATTPGKGAFASGQSLMYPEAQAGLDVLGRTMPSSGTAERMLTGAQAAKMLGGAGAEAATAVAAPQVLVPAALSSLLYSRPAMNVLGKMATQRPEFMRQAAPLSSAAAAKAAGVSAATPQQNQ